MEIPQDKPKPMNYMNVTFMSSPYSTFTSSLLKDSYLHTPFGYGYRKGDGTIILPNIFALYNPLNFYYK